MDTEGGGVVKLHANNVPKNECSFLKISAHCTHDSKGPVGEGHGGPLQVKEPETSMPAVHAAGLGTSMEATCSQPENRLPMFMPPKGKPTPKGLSLCMPYP